jgi:hypothetical protein
LWSFPNFWHLTLQLWRVMGLAFPAKQAHNLFEDSALRLTPRAGFTPPSVRAGDGVFLKAQIYNERSLFVKNYFWFDWRGSTVV